MLDTTLSATPDMGETPATAAQVWARLGTAIAAHNLPEPNSITVSHSGAAIYLHDTYGHDHNDLHTWVAWLGAGDLTTRAYDAPKPGHMQRDTSATATWRGWDIRVVLIEVVPVETVAVAYGQTGGAR